MNLPSSLSEAQQAWPPLREAMVAHRSLLLRYSGWFCLAGILAYFPGNFEVSTKLLLPQLPMTPGYNVTVGLGLPPEIYTYFNPRQPSELYLSLGTSDRLRWEVAREMASTRVRGTGKALDRATARLERRLKGDVRINVLRGGLLDFRVEGHSPEEIRWIARLYAKKYVDNISEIQKGSILKKRLVIEERLNAVIAETALIQQQFTAFRNMKGVVLPENQIGVSIGLYGSLASILVTRQAQLQSLTLGATAENPDIKRLRQEIASLQSQMDAIENSDRKGLLSIKGVSKEVGDYAFLLLRQKHLETLKEAFSRALQVSIFEESATTVSATLVDENQGEPERNLRFWPLLLLLSFLSLVHRHWLLAAIRKMQG